jgi:alpha-L-fucosidase
MAVATVPGFAPVHEYAEWYWSHISDQCLADVVLHPAPMPEVQAWHRAHHGSRPYDDFISDLTMKRWDAAEIAELAVDAGMGYVIHTSKHHDGYCFFDSALTERTTVHSGPRRDPVGELAAASRTAGLVYGLYYSLLDWSHPAYGDPEYVADYLHPQVAELVERYAPAVLWGDGHWGRPPDYWRSDAILESYYRVMGDSGAVNDRWGNSHADFVTFEYDTPASAPGRAFEVCRGLGYSFGYNRAETVGDHLTPSQLVSLLTETVAKGGNLLIDIGPRADGSVPDEQADVLRAAGRWVTAHASAIDDTVPFEVWGDASTRYTTTPSDDGLVHLHAIDLSGASQPRLTALQPSRFEVISADVEFTQDRNGVRLERPENAATELATVYELVLRSVERSRIEVAVRTSAARVGNVEFDTIGAALLTAAPGDVVEVADGRHAAPSEVFPLRVPAGVTLRGNAAVLDADGAAIEAVVVLAGDGSGVRGVSIAGVSAPGFLLPATGVLAHSVSEPAIEGCTLVESSIRIENCSQAVVTANSLQGGGIALTDSVDGAIVGNEQSGQRWGTGIVVEGGSRNRIIGNRTIDDLTGIATRGTADAVVSANQVRARWWGIHVDRSTSTSVSGNEVDRTMRSICISGGSRTRITGNQLTRCDSAVMIEAGATSTEVLDNTIDDCRVGLFVWESEPPIDSSNRVLRPREVAP